jgi:hypothetical protein
VFWRTPPKHLSVADPVVHSHFGRLGTGEEIVTVWIHHGFGAGAMGWEVVEREVKQVCV